MGRTYPDTTAGRPATPSAALVPEVDVVGPWNVNAPYRLEELSASTDRSYQALTDLIIKRVSAFAVAHHIPRLEILDVGCGIGFLSRSLATAGHQVDGIDPSEASIKLAADQSNDVTFHVSTLEEFPRGRRFDVLVANMTLHCVAKLPAFMEGAAAFLKPTGIFIATIPNPESYLQRRGDVRLDAVDLAQEHRLEIPFRIHDRPSHPAAVYFFHRPLRTYAAAARGAGLMVDWYETPAQIGVGKPQDVAVLVLRRHSTATQL